MNNNDDRLWQCNSHETCGFPRCPDSKPHKKNLDCEACICPNTNKPVMCLMIKKVKE